MIDRKKHMIVEGWRFIPHSFAVVNQWQLLALLRRGDIELSVVDVPFHSPQWAATTGLFDEADEAALRALPRSSADAAADVTLRIAFPFDFTLSRSPTTVVFATSEAQSLRCASFRQIPVLERLIGNRHFRIVTPSTWSAKGFFQLGFGPDQVLIVPHGVDLATFAPRVAPMSDFRAKLDLDEDDFVFLSVGAMTYYKGMDVLLKAFAATLATFPRVRLVLKGSDALYDSKQALAATVSALSPAEQQRVLANVRYLGGSLSHRAMARLYQSADAYVSPYRGEGFNLPVLEAAACGIPLIVTDGGSTDDFVTDAFARRIRSSVVHRAETQTPFLAPASGGRTGMLTLEPNLDHLVAEMGAVVGDEAWRRRASAAGASHVRAHYGWDRVTDRLVEHLMN